MDAINKDPKSLNDGQLDGAIEWLAARGRDEQAAGFRREKLSRAFQAALRERMTPSDPAMPADPYLANTTSVVLS